MCISDDPITAAYQGYRDELVGAGLLIPLGVPGVYGRSGVFEAVVEHFERYVTLGTADQALAHRDFWRGRALEMLRSVGLDARPVVANDPFFGRGGRMMAAAQKEQDLKYELVVPVATAERPTAVASSNYHLDHFGHAFGIRTADGKPAHSAC